MREQIYFVIPGRAEGANPESGSMHGDRRWIPDRRCAASGMTGWDE